MLFFYKIQPYKVSFCSLIKGITLKIHMLLFYKINWTKIVILIVDLTKLEGHGLNPVHFANLCEPTYTL